MGYFQPKPFKQKINGVWTLVKPKPVEFTIVIKRGGKQKMPDLKQGRNAA